HSSSLSSDEFVGPTRRGIHGDRTEPRGVAPILGLPKPQAVLGRTAMSVHVSETRVVRGACPQDCPDTCAFLYHVEDGKLVEVTGDPEHPMTRGGLCVKLKNFAEHHYNPDRLLHPMGRVGPKGSGQFERTTWEDALAEIRTR